jgi:hypothetical protein
LDSDEAAAEAAERIEGDPEGRALMDIEFVWLIFAAVFSAMAAWEFRGARTGIKVDLLDLGFPDMNEAQERLRDGIVAADKRSHRTARCLLRTCRAGCHGKFRCCDHLLSDRAGIPPPLGEYRGNAKGPGAPAPFVCAGRSRRGDGI